MVVVGNEATGDLATATRHSSVCLRLPLSHDHWALLLAPPSSSCILHPSSGQVLSLCLSQVLHHRLC